MIDLTAALARYYAENDDRRGDEFAAHVSDLSFCTLKAWARRNGFPQLPPSRETRTKWAMGHQVEDHVAEAFASSLASDGWRLVRDRRVSLRLEDGKLMGRVLTADEQPEPNEIVGHLDYALEHDTQGPIVVECKSTSFLKGKPPAQASEWYIMQAASYAAGIGSEQFAVFVVCRESGKVAEFWFRTADHIDAVRERAAEIIATTSEHVLAPQPNPRFAWECKHCPNFDCAKNVNPQRLAVAS